MKERLLFIGTALALISYGCGSSDGGGSATNPVDNPAAEAAADGAVGATQMLTELKTEPSSGGALGAMSNMYGQLSGMASAGTTGISGFAEISSPKAGLDTCVAATKTLITYADCDYGMTRIDGTVGVNGDSFSADLTINSAAAGASVGFTMVASLTVRQSAAGLYDFGDVRAEFGPTCGDVQLYN